MRKCVLRVISSTDQKTTIAEVPESREVLPEIGEMVTCIDENRKFICWVLNVREARVKGARDNTVIIEVLQRSTVMI